MNIDVTGAMALILALFVFGFIVALNLIDQLRTENDALKKKVKELEYPN